MNLNQIIKILNSGEFIKLDKSQQLNAIDTLTKSNFDAYEKMGKDYAEFHNQFIESVREELKPIIQQALDVFPQQNINVLDVGCGSAEELSFFQSYKNIDAVGLEISQFFIDMAKQKEQTGELIPKSVIKGNAEGLPFDADYFHFLSAQNVLLHIPYIQNSNLGADLFFSESARALKKNGLLLLTMREGDVCHIETETGRFFQLYNENDIKNLADKYGFKILTFERIHKGNFKNPNWQKWLKVVIQLK